MIRVAMLPVVIFALVMVLNWRDRKEDGDGPGEANVPAFLLGFVAAIVLANTGWITPKGISALTFASAVCLMVSMVALGANSSVKGVLTLGPQAVGALLLQTLIIAAIAGAGVALLVANG